MENAVSSTVSSRPRTRDSSRPPTDAPEIRPLTAEERLQTLLGRPPNGINPVFFREEFCAFCGFEHKNPSILDMYGSCQTCGCIIREPIHLRKRYAHVDQVDPLEILFATYGDTKDPMKAIDVTQICRQKIHEYWKLDRILIKSKEHLDELFGCDPSPNNYKQIRIRYRIDKTCGTVVIDVLPQNQTPSAFLLVAPKNRYLKIFRATYGHPKGMSSTGRMQYDVGLVVTELLQGFVDVGGGSYLEISCNTPLGSILGDPCLGYPKDLRCQYEVSGRSGVLYRDESRHHLKKRLYLEEAPTIAPLIFVVSATYGLTPTGRRDILTSLEKQLSVIQVIEHRLSQGMRLQPEDVALLKSKASLLEEKELFLKVPINFVDISYKLQLMADKGITTLFLDKNSFDPNAAFGNPAKGIKKLLEVSLSCQGHDSERETDSQEMTESGHPRNFITNKNARYIIVVNDDPQTGIGKMKESLYFETQYSSPIILITRATYGDFSDMSKIVDVTMEVQSKVRGRILCIERTENLLELFSKDPCPGMKKRLKVEYTTRGIVGNLRVREKDDHLVAMVRVGYPPIPPMDD